MTALALDIGGSKLAAARVGPDGAPVAARSVPTPGTEVWRACVELLSSFADPAGVHALGISAPGPMDTTTGSIAPINMPEWHDGFALKDAVSQHFPRATTKIAGDGACAALAEHVFGAARGVPDLLGIVVSSGIGGGVIRGGRIVQGRTGNAGHVGHIPVAGSDEICACGGVGCVETVASGPSAVRWARSQGWPGSTGSELARAAQAGDRIAVAALHRAGTALGAAIGGAAALLDVDLVVIGGGFAQSGAPLWDPLRASVSRHTGLRFLQGLRVLPAELGPGASLAGAAALIGA